MLIDQNELYYYNQEYEVAVKFNDVIKHLKEDDGNWITSNIIIPSVPSIIRSIEPPTSIMTIKISDIPFCSKWQLITRKQLYNFTKYDMNVIAATSLYPEIKDKAMKSLISMQTEETFFRYTTIITI